MSFLSLSESSLSYDSLSSSESVSEYKSEPSASFFVCWTYFCFPIVADVSLFFIPLDSIEVIDEVLPLPADFCPPLLKDLSSEPRLLLDSVRVLWNFISPVDWFSAILSGSWLKVVYFMLSSSEVSSKMGSGSLPPYGKSTFYAIY